MLREVKYVSPVVTNVNNNNNNNDYLHLQEQQQRQLRSISATMKVKTTTPTTSIRIASNWFDSKTYEAMHSFATKEEKTASKTLVLMPEWTTFTIFTTGRFFTPFTTTLTVHSTAATTLSSDISTNAVSITNMTATKSREQYFISEKSSTTANGAFIMASDEMQSKQVQKTEHNSIRTHKTEQNNMIETKSTSSYNCTTKTTTTKGDKISNNINGSTASTTIVSNTSSDGNVATNPSSSQITDDVGQGNLIEKPTGRHTRHQEHKVVTTIPLESIPLYSITLEQQQQHRQNTEHRNNKKDNYRQDVATSTSSSRTVTITKASKSKRTERTNAIQQPLNQLRRPLLVTATTPSSLLQRYARQAADAEQSDKCRMFVEGDPAKNEFYSPEFPNNYTKNINCTRVIVAMMGHANVLRFVHNPPRYVQRIELV
uniref:CUB domain-containing protein n=1 Tax=Glossina brevipalpis TaxID=37001 RepID=A0A1A9WGQ0_9MUSC